MIQPKDELIRDTKISGIKKQVAECINAVFSKGYETCFEQKKEIEDKAYQQGLCDAWNMMKYICGGRERLLKVFGTISITKIIADNTASEAVEKIREYEKKQKDKTEIKVGTKVRTTKEYDHFGTRVFPTGTVGTVTEIDQDIQRYKVSANGGYWWYSKDMFEVIEEDENQKEQDPKTGYWIALDECSNSGYYCSKCHKKVVKEGWSDTVKKIKFCPNCGIKME